MAFAATTFALLLAVAGAFSAMQAATQTVRVRVVDGRNGKTIKDERVQVWVGKTVNPVEPQSGPDGVAIFNAPEGSSIEIESNLYVDCRPFRKDAPRPVYSVDEIERTGIATANSCGKYKTTAKPGELVFYVRPLHFWEGMTR